MTEAQEMLFRTPQEAIVFAYHYSMQQQGRPLADRLAAPGARMSKGLSGNDGAGQAGMILAELHGLASLERAALVARYAPRSIPCSCKSACCSGHMPNPTWRDAILELEQHSQTLLAGHAPNYWLRRRLIEKAVGLKVELKSLAKESGVSEKTAAAHWRIIKEWMSGRAAQHTISRTDRSRTREADTDSGTHSAPAIDGLLSSARRNADNILSALDFIGEA